MKGLVLVARAKEISGRKVDVESSLKAGGVVTATLRGTFVAVEGGHPAAGRWSGDGEEGRR